MLDQAQWDPKAVKRLEDLVGNQDIWRPLAADIRNNTCPHIVLCGPPGCGKSLFIHLLLEQEMRVPVLRIECTANSGLRDMRDVLRGFARGSRTGRGDYRWVILEHADAIAGDTQAFLRRMMETTSNSTRFLFECNDAGAVSEPILSRSTLYAVAAPTETEIRYEIQRRTEFTLATEAVTAICAFAGQNLRNALYYALAARWNAPALDCVGNYGKYRAVLDRAPKTGDEAAWLRWAIDAEKECRVQGMDCRDLLMIGWPTNPDISYMRSQWSRLGGISSRALFFRAVDRVRQTV
jgi:DNA polymerase III delta prime subunit